MPEAETEQLADEGAALSWRELVLANLNQINAHLGRLNGSVADVKVDQARLEGEVHALQTINVNTKEARKFRWSRWQVWVAAAGVITGLALNSNVDKAVGAAIHALFP